MKKKINKILVTGAAGFIGHKICIELIKKKFKVIAVDDLSSGQKSNIIRGIKFFKLDLSIEKNLKKIPRCDYVFHLAGQSSGDRSFDSPSNDLKKNTLTTINLINYSIKNNCKKIIFASSMSVYGNNTSLSVKENDKTAPISCYGVSKLASENYLKIYSKKINYVIFRMFNVYGPGQNLKDLGQGMVSIYISQYLKSGKIKVKGSFNRIRDFIYIDDVVEIWINSLNNKIINQTFNLGTGISTKISKLLRFITISKNIKKFSSTRGDQNRIISNTKKLKLFFNKKNFINIENGIRKFIEYEKSK